ncbi:MAG TPA: hypothetical protein ENI27_03910 [bacterium]|nr:hypothetical protein [bacterium]
MDSVKVVEKVDSIREEGLERLSEFFSMTEDEIKTKKPDLLKTMTSQANMALKLNRDLSLDARAGMSHKIRIATLVTENKAELKDILKNGVQKYIE